MRAWDRETRCPYHKVLRSTMPFLAVRSCQTDSQMSVGVSHLDVIRGRLLELLARG